MSRKEAEIPAAPIAPLDKEVVRLPDGRELTYYRFPEAAPPPAAPPPSAPAQKGR